jgi:DNA polymerase
MRRVSRREIIIEVPLMNTEDKIKTARFLDLVADALGTGYRSQAREYNFKDETPEMTDTNTEPETNVEPGTENKADTLEKIAAEIKACRACPLCEKRTNAAPGEGVEHPVVLVVGEGPGAEEDKTGRPFVGRAGQLLDKMLESICLSRKTNCFIANVVKCRPPENRDPFPGETAMCAGFLERQIRLLGPKFILCAGRIAAQTMLRTTESAGKLRGKFKNYSLGDTEIPLLVTYHPSALLRNEELKRPAWEDLKLLRAEISGTTEAREG